MRGLRAAWNFLTHPAVSAVGNAVFLLTLIPVVLVVVAWFIEQPSLFVVAVVLLLIDTAFIGRLAFQRRREQSAGKASGSLSITERREALDNLFYPPRDDRRELGEECATFAMRMRVFNEEQEWKREKATARKAEELREANPDADPFKVREEAESQFERAVEAAYGSEMRDKGLRLFDAAREAGEIQAKSRRLVERPHAFEMEEVPNLFVVLARRLGVEPASGRSSIRPPADLADELDDLMREGIDLVDEFSEPVSPVRTPSGHWKLEGGSAPDDWWEKADGFAGRIRKLLIEHHPALLTDYRDGYNAHLKKEGEESKKQDPAADKRSTADKMLDLANFERSGPRRVIEASLEGLAAARHRIGSDPAKGPSI